LQGSNIVGNNQKSQKDKVYVCGEGGIKQLCQSKGRSVW
jgi:hypothetical protein